VSVIKFALLPDPARWPLGAQLLEQAVEGDGSATKDFANVLTSDGFRIGFEQNVALTCADAPARQTAAQWPAVVRRLTAVSRVGGPPFGWLTGAPCSAWPARSAVRYTGPWDAMTRTPILLVNTRYEPNTPLSAARAVQRRLGSAVLLVHDGYGHLNHVDPSACVDAALSDYLVRLRTPARGTVCPSDHVPFAPDFPAPQG
jgi:TAP-like protein